MNAFFHIGPLVVTQYVANRDPNQLPMPEGEPPKKLGHKVKIPALTMAKWDWLQPYKTGAGTGSLEEEITYDAFNVGLTDERPKFEERPYKDI